MALSNEQRRMWNEAVDGWRDEQRRKGMEPNQRDIVQIADHLAACEDLLREIGTTAQALLVEVDKRKPIFIEGEDGSRTRTVFVSYVLWRDWQQQIDALLAASVRPTTSSDGGEE